MSCRTAAYNLEMLAHEQPSLIALHKENLVLKDRIAVLEYQMHDRATRTAAGPLALTTSPLASPTIAEESPFVLPPLSPVVQKMLQNFDRLQALDIPKPPVYSPKPLVGANRSSGTTVQRHAHRMEPAS